MAPGVFRQRIRASIADEQLQAALDANADRRLKGRVTAFESLPDWRARRQRAHAVRAEVIAHLAEYLARFEGRAEANGMKVHRARDAAEAVEIVLRIAQAAGGKVGAKLFAKSKSMVSEEIGLNHALEAQGHRVIETDLGEYIVQLRGERPSHIITPAVHLQRKQVGELFHEKLGMPYTDDIPMMTAAARKVLREVFLTADVGISGVNFGVAESGTVCIVTNEGNGRMVTTEPAVHIALMGMERLVPTLDDLALMLSLLPRSATGQKLSVYTQLIHGPRRAGEADGATERHVIIVDNGRRRLQESRMQEALYCIRCGACLNACPVFRELGGHAYVGTDGDPAPYPGPIGSIVSPGLLGLKQFGYLAQASSLCGACKDVCPVDIDLPMLLTRVRAGVDGGGNEDRGTGLAPATRLGLWAYQAIGSSSTLFGAAQRLAGLGSRVLSPHSEWMRLQAFTGWGLSKDFPRPAHRPFRARWRDLQGSPAEEAAIPARPAGREQTPLARPSAARELDQEFAEELEALGGTVVRVKASELTDRLGDYLLQRGMDAAMVWETLESLDRGRLAEAGLRTMTELDATVKAGITGCTCAIAETGTVLICGGKGEPLGTSLLPEMHVAVVAPNQIVKTVEEALRRAEVLESKAAVLISGPSRTADIEMTLTIGVHGPGELVVFLVD